MEKAIFEQMNGTYTNQGDYLIPNFTVTAEEEKPIGLWGQRHLKYLKQHRKVLYYNLLTSGKLNSYLVDIDIQAEELFYRLVNQMAEREGVTEQLKANSPMEWVGWMNNIRSRAIEVVNTDIIFA